MYLSSETTHRIFRLIKYLQRTKEHLTIGTSWPIVSTEGITCVLSQCGAVIWDDADKWIRYAVCLRPPSSPEVKIFVLLNPRTWLGSQGTSWCWCKENQRYTNRSPVPSIFLLQSHESKLELMKRIKRLSNQYSKAVISPGSYTCLANKDCMGIRHTWKVWIQLIP